MNKKFLSAILFGALMVFSTGTFVSCSDYDDDIDRIDSELADLKTQLNALQSQVNSGKYVTNVTKEGNGIKVTWNDGTTSTIESIKGDKGDKGDTGAAGVAGAKGEATVITIDPVTKNWLIDGVDTGVCSEGKNGADGKDGQNGADGKDGKDGKDAPKPIFTVGEDGHIYVQYGEDGEKEDLGASTGGIFYVDKGLYYELHVCDAEGNWADIKLPRTAAISSIKALTLNGSKITKDGATVNLTYNIAAKDGKYLDGTKFKKGDILVSKAAKVVAQINPTMADANLYDFYLTDSKGASILTLGAAAEYTTETAISRAATANKGIYQFPVSVVSGVTMKQIAATNGVAYAIATEDVFGNELLSSYDVAVVAAEADAKGLQVPNTKVLVTVGEDYDLIGEETVTVGNAVDYKFYIPANQTANADAANASISADGVISGGVVGKELTVAVDWLDYQGQGTAGTPNRNYITVKFIAPAAENAYTKEITPVGKADKDVVTFDLTTILGNGSSANYSNIVIGEMKFTADAEDKNTIVNDAYKVYKKNALANEFIVKPSAVTATADKNAAGESTGYYTRTVSYNVVAGKVIPGTYKATIQYGSEPTNELTLTVVVKDPGASFEFKPLALYFSGNEAVTYGTTVIGSDKITYNLKGLFGLADWTNVKFSETVEKAYKDANGITWTANKWLVDATSGNISVDPVAKADAATKTGIFGGAYEPHALKATYTPLANANFAAVSYAFNLTIKSDVYEGSLIYRLRGSEIKDANGKGTDEYNYTTGAEKTIKVGSSTTSVKLYADEILGTLMTGTTYNPTDAETAKIEKVTVALEGDDAKMYLNPISVTDTWANGYTISVKADVTAPAAGQSVTCKVRVSVVDQWGKTKTVDVPVTLK